MIAHTGKRFWGLFRDDELFEVHKSRASASGAMSRYKPGSKHKWAIAAVQVFYG